MKYIVKKVTNTYVHGFKTGDLLKEVQFIWLLNRGDGRFDLIEVTAGLT
jgi:hypothetical protein